MTIEAKILELEGKAELPNLKNEVVIQDGDKTIRYEAHAFKLKAKPSGVSGFCHLSRYDTENYVNAKRRKIGFLKALLLKDLSVESLTEIKNRETLVWRVLSYNPIYYDNRFDYDSGGGVIISVNQFHHEITFPPAFGIRSNLRANAINQGLALSDKLLDLAFGPIEEQLIKRYSEILNYEKGNPT